MTEARPPIRPRDDDWPETRDYHREQADEIARLREALRVALEALEETNRRTGLLIHQNTGRWKMSLEHDRRTVDVIGSNMEIARAAIARAEKAELQVTEYELARDAVLCELGRDLNAVNAERDTLRALLREARNQLITLDAIDATVARIDAALKGGEE